MLFQQTNEALDRRLVRRGFTLVELLVVIIVLAVLAAIVLPKFINSSKRGKESAMKSDLKLLRNAIASFENDTNYYPLTLSDLAATSAPAKGLDASGAQKDIAATDWHGPYVEAVPQDPISRGAYTYITASPNVGKVKSSASGAGMDSTSYASW